MTNKLLQRDKIYKLVELRNRLNILYDEIKLVVPFSLVLDSIETVVSHIDNEIKTVLQQEFTAGRITIHVDEEEGTNEQ
jgi:hypothetical protein